MSPRRVVLHGPGGVHGGEDELRALLGGADAELYRTVFAFGLAELADLGTLEADAVRERIFSAGVVGAGRSAASAMAQLDRRAGALLTATGRSGRIRELERELKLAEGALRAARAESAMHVRARADEEEARDAVVRLRAAAGAVAAEERRARRLVELWPMETGRAKLAAELAALPADPGIDDASEARLERALTQAAAAEEALRVRTAELDAATDAFEAAACDERLAPVAGEVRALARERAALRRAPGAARGPAGGVRVRDGHAAGRARAPRPGLGPRAAGGLRRVDPHGRAGARLGRSACEDRGGRPPGRGGRARPPRVRDRGAARARRGATRG